MDLEKISHLEKELNDFCVENKNIKINIGKNDGKNGFIRVIGSEIILYKPSIIFTNKASGRFQDSIGKIDLLFLFYGKKYVAEIKYAEKRPDTFWSALKVIGYCEYYKWQKGENGWFPAIIMPKDSIKLEHKIVTNKLGILLFGAYKNGKEWKIDVENID